MRIQFDRFSKDVREVLIRARDQAQKMGNNNVQTEHVLWGIVAEEACVAATILEKLNVESGQMHKRLEKRMNCGECDEEETLNLGKQTESVITLSIDEARRGGYNHINTAHLLIGLLRDGNNVAAEVLGQMGINTHSVRAQLEYLNLPKISAGFPPLLLDRQHPSKQRNRFIMPSPIFGLLVLIAIAAGYLTFQRTFIPAFMLFLFVTAGWIISLCLHEFGHALAAWCGGDKQVVDKGYLTLNPLKYTHRAFSILLPLIFLAMGGIGLPGGAVYINIALIPKRFMRSLMSAAGPLVSAMCAVVLSVPFMMGLDEQYFMHLEF